MVVGRWYREVERGLARIEAVIDFGEDDGIADEVAAGVEPLISAVLEDMSTHQSAGAPPLLEPLEFINALSCVGIR